jgi:hypothetical protein
VKRDKHSKLFYPSPRHQTAYLRVPCPVTPEHPRGYFVENTGLSRREAGGPEAWTAKAEKARGEAERAYLNALDPKVAVPQVIPTRRTVRQFADVVEKDAFLNCSPAWARCVRGYLKFAKGKSLLGPEAKKGLSKRALLAWKKACTESGIEDFKPYDLRAIFQTRAALGGASDLQTKAAMAHSCGQTDDYVLQTLAGEAMKAAARQAEKERREAKKSARVVAFRQR